MIAHSKLGPSSAERWMTCPGSVRLIDEVYPDGVDDSSEYSTEGTRAHTIAEITAARGFKLRPPSELNRQKADWARETPEEQQAEMIEYALQYRSVLKDLVGPVRKNDPKPLILLEQRVHTRIPGVWGTADALILSKRKLTVADYKYGRGVLVRPEENPQLMLYGIGALELVGDLLGDFQSLVDEVELVVHQPRASETPATWSVSVPDLLEWRDVVRPQAELAMSGTGYLSPSEKACRWCPVRGVCRTRAEFATKRDFGEPETLSPEELAQLLVDLPQIEAWVTDVKHRALSLALNEDTEIPGWKVVRSGGKRSIVDHQAAISRLVDAGYPESEVSRRTAETLGRLEKLVGGRTKLSAILGELVRKGEGREILVPEDDERPAVNSLDEAKLDFA